MITGRDQMYDEFVRITPDASERELIILSVLADATFHLNDEGWHVYFDASCHHDDHGMCEKECKACSSPCVCHCHYLREETDGL